MRVTIAKAFLITVKCMLYFGCGFPLIGPDEVPVSFIDCSSCFRIELIYVIQSYAKAAHTGK